MSAELDSTTFEGRFTLDVCVHFVEDFHSYLLRALAGNLRYYFCKLLEVALDGRKILGLGALLILGAHSAFKSGNFILYLHLFLT